jgi:hypothetical protein
MSRLAPCSHLYVSFARLPTINQIMHVRHVFETRV